MKKKLFSILLTVMCLWAMSVPGYAATGNTDTGSVEELTSVSYMDWDETTGEFVEKTLGQGEFQMLSGRSAGRTGGWYVAAGNCRITKWMIEEDINLILCDGATLTASDGLYAGPMRYSNMPSRITDQPHTINIYGQKKGTGSLVAEGSCGLANGLIPNQDVPYGIFCYDLNIYGGNVTANGGSGYKSRGGDGVYSDGRIRVYGGTLNASGGADAVGGIFGDLDIYGGAVNASLSNGPAVYGKVSISGGKLAAAGSPNALWFDPSVGEASVLVADNASGTGAKAWDGTGSLTAYPYVSVDFTGDDDTNGIFASAFSEGSIGLIIGCCALLIGLGIVLLIGKKKRSAE